MGVLFFVCCQVSVYSLGHKLQVKLADPDIVSNPSEYQKLAQSVAELDEVVHFCCLLCFLYFSERIHMISFEIVLF